MTEASKCSFVSSDFFVTPQRNIPGKLLVTRGQWQWTIRTPSHFRLVGRMHVFNETESNEIFITEATANATLLSRSSIDGISCSTRIDPVHPGGKPAARSDGYWVGYIIRARESTAMEVSVDVRWSEGVGDSHSSAAERAGDREGGGGSPLLSLEALCLDVSYVAYGPMGRCPASQHVILPLRFPERPLEGAPATGSAAGWDDSSKDQQGQQQQEQQHKRHQQDVMQQQQPAWREVSEGVFVLPVRTHLLCHLDDPMAVIRRYLARS